MLSHSLRMRPFPFGPWLASRPTRYARFALLLLTAATLTFQTSSLDGAAVSINFVGGSFNGNPTPLGPQAVAGVIAAPNWNNVASNLASGTVTGLIDSTGASTVASVSWSCDDLWSTPIS